MAMTQPTHDTRQLATVQSGVGEIMEEVVAKGDLKALSAEQRASYYSNVCKSMGLNPFTKPFEYITLNGKLTLYATRTAADQLRKINGVSITGIEREIVDDLIVVTVRVQDRDGRTDEEVGAVNFGGLKGEAKANAIMKAITKAKRRATLSICGLGWLDESEMDSIPSARPAHVDTATGEIVDATSAQDRPRAIEPPKDEPEPIDDEENHQRAIKHIHAAARDVGISHHVLSHWAKEAARKNGSEIESMAEAPTAWLDGMARWVKNNPAKSRKLAAEVEPLPMDEAIETALANATPTDVDTGGDSR